MRDATILARLYLIQSNVAGLIAEVKASAADEADQVGPGEYTSPCPEGYDTVLGYTFRNNPEALDLMDPSPQSTVDDGFWLTHECRRRGVTPIKVTAPMVLQREGIIEVNAYPLHILARRLG